MTETPWWASEDPWSLSPAEAEAAEAKRRERDAEKAATPEHPPY